MKWIALDSDNKMLLFSSKYKPDPVSFKIDSEIINRFMQDSFVASDYGLIKERSLNFTFDILAEDDKDFRYELNTIWSFFQVIGEKKFYLQDIDNRIRIEVRMKELIPNYEKGSEYRVGKDCGINFVILSGLFETVEFAETGEQTLNDKDEFSIIIDSPTGPISPIIVLTGISPNTRFSLSCENSLTACEIQEQGFGEDDIIELDSRNGKAKINSIENPNMVTRGSFIKLQKGVNKIKYQSIPGGVQVKMGIKHKLRTAF